MAKVPRSKTPQEVYEKAKAEFERADGRSSRGWIDTAEVAVLVRHGLKREFPGVKFSVTISRYAGGSSINVKYAGGPPERAVYHWLGQYAGNRFDGMIDLQYGADHYLLPDGTAIFARTYGHSYDGPQGNDANPMPPPPNAIPVHFGSGYLFASREDTEEEKRAAERMIADAAGTYQPNTRYLLSVWQRDDEREVLVTHDPNGGGEWGSSLVHQIIDAKAKVAYGYDRYGHKREPAEVA